MDILKKQILNKVDRQNKCYSEDQQANKIQKKYKKSHMIFLKLGEW